MGEVELGEGLRKGNGGGTGRTMNTKVKRNQIVTNFIQQNLPSFLTSVLL